MSLPGYLTHVTDSGIPYVDLSASAVPVQWRLYERHTNALTLSARDIVEDARIRHWSFSEIQLGDGAATRYLNTLQRHLLLRVRDGLKGVMTLTVRTRTSMPATGTRIGVTPRGVPFLIEDGDTSDGYAVYLSEGQQAPYIDMAGVPIAFRPLTDGFPLPAELISMTAFKGVLADGATIPVTVTTEQQRSVQMTGRSLTAFASGNRLVPLLPPGSPSALNTWTTAPYVEISYIAVARITALCCLLSFPTVLIDALTAGVAKLYAKQAKNCPPVEKAGFVSDAEKAEREITDSANDILGEPMSRSVTFKG